MVARPTRKRIKRGIRKFKTRPKRLGFFTIGDSYLEVYDIKAHDSDLDLGDNGAEEEGVHLATVKTLTPIDGVSG